MVIMHGHGLFKTKYIVAMAQAVSCRSVTAEDRVRSQASPCEMRSGRSGTWTGGFSEYFCLPPVSFIPQMLRTHLRIHVALSRFPEAMIFRTSGSLG